MSRERTARTRGSSADEDGGEGYFASVSDLMVGVLFVFLLMLTVFALNFRDAEQAQMVEREKYEQALRDLQQQRQIASEQENLARVAQAEAARQEANAQRNWLRTSACANCCAVRWRNQQDIEDRAAARLRLLAFFATGLA